ncbi:glycosyltransferase family 2 protein [Aestuariibacter salexigens]|uniref:glycosyltransferase family 2 protein n=1 Tax=Aestuariibacter salexigens TaxID=226010 RepID=UPI000412FBCC|nr:glycosyltransferase family 2 protein [Aestuariibacter salexigens]
MNTQLSVIIPNYNCLQYLPKCLDSVFCQLPKHCEVIVIDDGSTDNSTDWLHERQLINLQLRVLKQQNLGVVAARNFAIQEAHGEWVAFLDADDFWYPNKIGHQLRYMQQNKGCVMSFTNYDHVDEDYQYIIDCFSYWREVTLPVTRHNNFNGLRDPLDTLLATNLVGTSTVMARKDALIACGLFDPSLNSASDWDMWLKLASAGHIAYNSHVQMGYLMRSGSITSNRLNRLSAMRTIIDNVCRNAQPSSHAVRIAEAKVCEGYAEYYREQENYSKAIKHGVLSFVNAPYLRTFKHLCLDIKKALLPWRTLSWSH